MSEEEEVAAGLVVVLVQKAREQDDGIRTTFERHKNIRVTFTVACHQHSQQKYHCSDSTQLQSLCLFAVDTGLWTPSMES